jgi:transcriptional regulator with PAS, ATPase and Fis domain
MKGAFTGAVRDTAGLFEIASGGTLFLDEIGELPLSLQVKLLRVLQEHEVRRVGSTQLTPIDARVIAATNRDLEAAVHSGNFRQDLYFRLNVLQIKLPPLRARKDDIPPLIDLFFNRFRNLSPPIQGFSKEAMARLEAYDWPGNVRDLENAIEHAIALSAGPMIDVNDLPSSISDASCGTSEPGGATSWREIERRVILRVLNENAGDRITVARLLGIGKTTLYRKLRDYKKGI